MGHCLTTDTASRSTSRKTVTKNGAKNRNSGRRKKAHDAPDPVKPKNNPLIAPKDPEVKPTSPILRALPEQLTATAFASKEPLRSAGSQNARQSLLGSQSASDPNMLLSLTDHIHVSGSLASGSAEYGDSTKSCNTLPSQVEASLVRGNKPDSAIPFVTSRVPDVPEDSESNRTNVSSGLNPPSKNRESFAATPQPSGIEDNAAMSSSDTRGSNRALQPNDFTSRGQLVEDDERKLSSSSESSVTRNANLTKEQRMWRRKVAGILRWLQQASFGQSASPVPEEVVIEGDAGIDSGNEKRLSGSFDRM